MTRRGAPTIPFEVDPRLPKESSGGDGDGGAMRLGCKQFKLTSDPGLLSTSSLGRRVADRVEPQGGGCAVVGPQATLFTTQDVTAPVAVRVVRHVEVRMQARPEADITCSCFVCWWAEDRARSCGKSLVVEGFFVARSSSLPHSHAFATYLWHVTGTGARSMLCAAGAWTGGFCTTRVAASDEVAEGGGKVVSTTMAPSSPSLLTSPSPLLHG